MKTLLPNKDYFIIDNEFYQVEKRLPTKYWIYKCNIKDEVEGSFEKNVLGDSWFERCHDKANYYDVVATTNPSLQGVKQLDRSLFVKGVDLNVMSREAMFKQTLVSGSSFCDGFEAGYNANKNDYTKSDMGKAFLAGVVGDQSLNEVITNLRPLSLPSSIIIEGEEITKINW